MTGQNIFRKRWHLVSRHNIHKDENRFPHTPKKCWLMLMLYWCEKIGSDAIDIWCWEVKSFNEWVLLKLRETGHGEAWLKVLKHPKEPRQKPALKQKAGNPFPSQNCQAGSVQPPMQRPSHHCITPKMFVFVVTGDSMLFCQGLLQVGTACHLYSLQPSSAFQSVCN